MTKKIQASSDSQLRLQQADLLICPACGCEFSVWPKAKKKLVCPNCISTVDKSRCMPLIALRKTWVCQEVLPQYYEQIVFKQVDAFYHQAVDLYRTLTQNVPKNAMMSRDSFVLGAVIASRFWYSVDFSQEAMRQVISQYVEGSVLFDFLDTGHVELGAGRGRPPRKERILLLIDALLLRLCPDGYVALLCDALTLRTKEYTIKETYGRAHQDRWKKFYKARDRVEVYCGRIWKDLFGEEPPAVPDDWWEEVARNQGLSG